VALPQAGADPPEDVPSELDNMRHQAFPELTFLKATDVDFLEDTEAILALTVAGDTRGYLIQIMTWHEIVNDTVGGVPAAVTYCPLCNFGLACQRQLASRLVSFGTSGRLWAQQPGHVRPANRVPVAIAVVHRVRRRAHRHQAGAPPDQPARLGRLPRHLPGRLGALPRHRPPASN
jgi:uncharacterized protein DUF3179